MGTFDPLGDFTGKGDSFWLILDHLSEGDPDLAMVPMEMTWSGAVGVCSGLGAKLWEPEGGVEIYLALNFKFDGQSGERLIQYRPLYHVIEK